MSESPVPTPAETPAARPLPPPLEFDDPPCSICGEDTYLEDGMYLCTPCGASWDAEFADSRPGWWDDDKGEQCPSEHRPWAGEKYANIPMLRDKVYRCRLATGHEAKKHVHPDWQRGWTDAEAVS